MNIDNQEAPEFFIFDLINWFKDDICEQDHCTIGLYIKICIRYWNSGGLCEMIEIDRLYAKYPEYERLRADLLEIKDNRLIISFLDIQIKQVLVERGLMNISENIEDSNRWTQSGF